MLMPKLKDELRYRNLKISGRACELINRLKMSDEERSLPFKRNVEIAARKRREEKPPPDELDFHVNFDRERQVLRGGPNGPPVYDDWGYELSYDKLNGSGTTNKQTILRRQEKSFERLWAKEEQITRIMFGVAKQTGTMDHSAMNWQVAKDLEIPWHKVEVCDYEAWKDLGFRAKEEDFVHGKVNKEMQKEIDRQMLGSAFRK
ncbi:hypothetical protein EJ08DRAFT_650007 [Tothia fuscella]|uniref:SAP domain-containing protein n=1 Tax=Tothia fuscella TaxID=1048955 RepID=A0A9P4NRL5_9PEZI|nr:hypothetical protein EJ08DRAFT_650007 [Tothia fuscella]